METEKGESLGVLSINGPGQLNIGFVDNRDRELRVTMFEVMMA